MLQTVPGNIPVVQVITAAPARCRIPRLLISEAMGQSGQEIADTDAST